MVTVYTKTNCPQCRMTEKLLDKMHIDYMNINIDENDSVRQRLRNKNIKSTPAVFKGGKFLFNGFKPDEIRKLK